MHSIGNSLKDVKVEFKKELKLDVSDISIEGKQGEILRSEERRVGKECCA